MVERALPNVDFRVVQMIQSSPQMMAEQGSGFMSQYGGPSGFIALDQAGIGDVYNALKGGAATAELPILTGLSNSEIARHLATLTKMGVIEPMSP